MARGRWLASVAALLALFAVSCGDSGPTPASQKELDGGADGKAGKTANTDGGQDAPTTDSPGDFASYWKRKTSALTVIDPDHPTDFMQKTVDLPAKLTDPVDGREVDIYIQIKDDTRYVYAYFTGDDVYYRSAEMLQKVDQTYFGTTETGNHLYEIKDGHLAETGATVIGMTSVSNEATFDKLAGDFPPPGWPSQMLEVPQ